jgi:hypothetical protein
MDDMHDRDNCKEFLREDRDSAEHRVAELEAQLADLSRLREVDAAQHQADEVEWNKQMAERDAERESHLELVRDLDRIWNGEGAAKQASLCDMVSQISVEKPTLDKLLLLAKEALVSASTFGGFVNAVAQKAIAAINDSKAVEGLILCDAVPRAWQRKWFADGEEPKKERNANGRLVLPSRFKFRPLTEIVVFKDDVPLYAPRRTEK